MFLQWIVSPQVEVPLELLISTFLRLYISALTYVVTKGKRCQYKCRKLTKPINYRISLVHIFVFNVINKIKGCLKKIENIYRNNFDPLASV